MKPLGAKDIKWIACLLVSGAVTYLSFQIGADRGYSGQSALLWLHVLLFLVAIGFVVLAIILKSK